MFTFSSPLQTCYNIATTLIKVDEEMNSKNKRNSTVNNNQYQRMNISSCCERKAFYYSSIFRKAAMIPSLAVYVGRKVGSEYVALVVSESHQRREKVKSPEEKVPPLPPEEHDHCPIENPLSSACAFAQTYQTIICKVE